MTIYVLATSVEKAVQIEMLFKQRHPDRKLTSVRLGTIDPESVDLLHYYGWSENVLQRLMGRAFESDRPIELVLQSNVILAEAPRNNYTVWRNRYGESNTTHPIEEIKA